MGEAERRGVFARMVPESGRALWETLNWWLDPLMTTSVAASAVRRRCWPWPASATASIRRRRWPRLPSATAATTLVMDGMSHWLVGEPGWKRVAEAVLGWLAAEGAL